MSRGAGGRLLLVRDDLPVRAELEHDVGDVRRDDEHRASTGHLHRDARVVRRRHYLPQQRRRDKL